MLEVRPKFPAALRRQRYTTLGLGMYGLFVLALAILLLAIEFDINPYQPPNGRMRLSFPWWMWPVFLISGGLGYFLSGVSVSLGRAGGVILILVPFLLPFLTGLDQLLANLLWPFWLLYLIASGMIFFPAAAVAFQEAERREKGKE